MRYAIEDRLNSEQAAGVLNASRSWLEKTRVFGGGPPFEKRSRMVRYRYGTLLEWAAAQTRGSTSDGRPPKQ